MKPTLYPLKFTPIYKEKIWGGNNLKKLFSRPLSQYKKIGESWEISDCGKDISRVKNGPLKGKSLKNLIHLYRKELLGTNVFDPQMLRFPLLIKLLDANDMLSVQVHPDDKYAREKEKQLNGKTEMWIVLNASKNAQIVYGFKKNLSKKEIINCIQENNIEKPLNKVKVKKGDAIFIPAGTVHAILPKLVIMEVQQSSDITYRLFDWNRVDKKGNKRALHLEQSLDVINFRRKGTGKIKPIVQKKEGNKIYKFLRSSYFSLDKIEIEKEFSEKVSQKSFLILFIVQGKGKIISNHPLNQTLSKGEFILIPASLSSYTIRGKNLELIKIYL